MENNINTVGVVDNKNSVEAGKLVNWEIRILQHAQAC